MPYNYLVHQKECVTYSLVQLDVVLLLLYALSISLLIKNVQIQFKRFGSKSLSGYCVCSVSKLLR